MSSPLEAGLAAQDGAPVALGHRYIHGGVRAQVLQDLHEFIYRDRYAALPFYFQGDMVLDGHFQVREHDLDSLVLGLHQEVL